MTLISSNLMIYCQVYVLNHQYLKMNLPLMFNETAKREIKKIKFCKVHVIWINFDEDAFKFNLIGGIFVKFYSRNMKFSNGTMRIWWEQTHYWKLRTNLYKLRFEKCRFDQKWIEKKNKIWFKNGLSKRKLLETVFRRNVLK